MYLISFKQAQFAYTFVDYMAVKNIVIRVESVADGSYQLFLDDYDVSISAFVQKELQQYLQNPNDQRYRNATWHNGEVEPAKINQKITSNIMPKITSAGAITLSVSVICVAVYLLLLVTSSIEVLAYLGYPFPSQAEQIWRYITPIFIHFSLLHIVFNLMWWWYLGGMVERLCSKWKLLELVIIAGLLSNYAEAAISGPYFGGLSGVVYALMGYVWLYGEQVPSSGLNLSRAMIGIAVVWILAGYLGLIDYVANTAHLSGLIIGLLLAAKDIWIIKKR